MLNPFRQKVINRCTTSSSSSLSETCEWVSATRVRHHDHLAVHRDRGQTCSQRRHSPTYVHLPWTTMAFRLPAAETHAQQTSCDATSTLAVTHDQHTRRTRRHAGGYLEPSFLPARSGAHSDSGQRCHWSIKANVDKEWYRRVNAYLRSPPANQLSPSRGGPSSSSSWGIGGRGGPALEGAREDNVANRPELYMSIKYGYGRDEIETVPGRARAGTRSVVGPVADATNALCRRSSPCRWWWIWGWPTSERVSATVVWHVLDWEIKHTQAGFVRCKHSHCHPWNMYLYLHQWCHFLDMLQ